MSNSHINPTILERLAPFIALPKAHRVFAVKINLGGEMHEMNLLSVSWFDAIGKACDLLGIDDDCPADGIAIDCRPAGESK